MAWSYNWTAGYNALTSAQRYENARLIFERLTSVYGWTDEAAAAVISNFQHEGELNPGQWQHGSTVGDWNNRNVGLGLGQWTPPSKIGSYCGGNTQAAVCNGDKQVDCTVLVPGQWVQRVNSHGYSNYYGYGGIPYITSISAFGQSSEDPEDLATCWCACWEGCSRDAFRRTYASRRSDARYWFEQFGGSQSGYPIHITVNGNGTAWASINEVEVHRAEAGQRVELGAVPGDGDYFQLWVVDSPSGLTLESPVTVPDNYFTMPASKVDLTAQFTGETPEPGPDPGPPGVNNLLPKKMPVWMYPLLRR